MIYNNFIILIPALDPDNNLIGLINGLHAKGFYHIVLTDDGSDEAHQIFFKKAIELDTVVAHHEKKMGKGAALRTALKIADEKIGDSDFYITADCDGEHTPDDIEKIAIELINHPDHFVLGVRKFEKTDGKKVSYWENYYQRLFFRMTNHGKECLDPRSGLRGFSSSLKKLALSTEGFSYDYEMNFLDSVVQQVPTSMIPISSQTYTINKNSHFRPVADLLGMYLKFWRYLFTSNLATIFDLILFAIFNILFQNFGAMTILMSTICARIISGMIGYVLNRYISFRSQLNPGREMIRYFIVFIAQMMASGLIVTILNIIPIPTVMIKAVVDFLLFFAVYNIQKNWVFAQKLV